MQIIKNTDELIKIRRNLKQNIGFVPTMGALHLGHLSLIQRSVAENELTIVSIFVNPTQFLEGEDFSKYPQTLEKDLQICKMAQVDIVFLPNTKSIYFKDELKIKAPPNRGFILEGLKRPAHFDGVLQVVLKLLNITTPTRAYFGKKDAQQFYLISKMARELFLDVEIVGCEIVRDDEGLALSSRNIYLSTDERKKALLISKSLKKSSDLVINGELETQLIKSKMREILTDVEIEYVEIVDREFRLLKNLEIHNSIILIAVRVGKTRLIDNIWI